MTAIPELTARMKEIKRAFSTGWFGIPGGPASKSTKVHIIKRRDTSKPGSRGKIICGSKVSSKHEYQWCTPGYGFDDEYLKLECQKCYKIAHKFWVEWLGVQAIGDKQKKIAWHKKQINLHKKQIRLLTN